MVCMGGRVADMRIVLVLLLISLSLSPLLCLSFFSSFPLCSTCRHAWRALQGGIVPLRQPATCNLEMVAAPSSPVQECDSATGPAPVWRLTHSLDARGAAKAHAIDASHVKTCMITVHACMSPGRIFFLVPSNRTSSAGSMPRQAPARSISHRNDCGDAVSIGERLRQTVKLRGTIMAVVVCRRKRANHTYTTRAPPPLLLSQH